MCQKLWHSSVYCVTRLGAAAQARAKRKRTSQYRGVSRAGAKWKATLTANGAKHELGRFDTELQAAQCAAPPRLHGGAAWSCAQHGCHYALLPL